jgi:host factor-I protein
MLLNAVRKSGLTTTITTLGNNKLTGQICAFDNYVILIEVGGKVNMVYKHAISTIEPQDKLVFQDLFKSSRQ